MQSTIHRSYEALALIGVTSAVLLLGCDAAAAPVEAPPLDPLPNEVVLAWNSIAYDALVEQDEYANPLVATRVYAMMHLAQHDALNAIHPAFDRYAYEGAAAEGADPVVAAAAAAHGVLTVLFPAQVESLDAQLAATVHASRDASSGSRGLLVGRSAAESVLARRADDGADTPLMGGYESVTEPGRYQPTPPFGFAFAPGWKDVKPFALTDAAQFRVGPPPALDSEAYAEAFDEVKRVGGADSDTRTAEQTAYGRWWYEFSDIGWNRVARVVAAERKLGLQSTARLFALLNMALADSYIAGWDSKYHYDFWRPYTAIREAARDGNAATDPDPMWEPAMPTPPVQDHPSTHSALGDAAAAVLASVFGDDVSFTVESTSADPAHAMRSFPSFSAAANENADSRVMAGLHFRFACEAGQELGRRVGEWTVGNHLRRI